MHSRISAFLAFLFLTNPPTFGQELPELEKLSPEQYRQIMDHRGEALAVCAAVMQLLSETVQPGLPPDEETFRREFDYHWLAEESKSWRVSARWSFEAGSETRSRTDNEALVENAFVIAYNRYQSELVGSNLRETLAPALDRCRSKNRGEQSEGVLTGGFLFDALESVLSPEQALAIKAELIQFYSEEQEQ